MRRVAGSARSALAVGGALAIGASRLAGFVTALVDHTELEASIESWVTRILRAWVAQGKSNPEISSILGAAENTVKKHLQHIFEKIGVDNRNAATLSALEVLASGQRPLG